MKKIVYIAAAAMMMSSCSLLELDESTGKTKEEAFSYFDNVNKLSNNVYSQLPNELNGFDGALREAATDNALYVWNESPIHKFYNNAWSPVVAIDNNWMKYYGAIESVNSFLENYNKEVLDRFEWTVEYKDDIKRAEMLQYELRVLRAFYFFELAKRYGDVPLVTKTLTASEANAFPRTPFEKVIQFIADECDACAAVLPVNHKDLLGETGRVTKGAAMAIKARALLYAASPLHNPKGDAKKWELAAKASRDIIDSNIYELQNIKSDPLYKKGGNDVLNSKQIIFERRNSDSNDFEKANLPISFQGGNTGNVPTQNLVDAFEMADGTPFDWNNPVHAANPYQNRDPRLALNVVYNGENYFNDVIEAFEGGKDSPQATGGSKTGYYLRKYINTSISLEPTKETKKPHHFILYRYGEVLLNYAEAMNEWKGADFKDAEYKLSAREALNMVRKAANMPEVKAVGDEFTKAVKNERRVELAFEDHRFWDIRRWCIGRETTEIRGVKITKENDRMVYKPYVIENRYWDDKMNLYPIPQREMTVPGNIKQQNAGW